MENKKPTGDRENRWSGWSTNTLATIPDVESEIENAPPVPPIPRDSQNIPQDNRWSGWSGKTNLSAPDLCRGCEKMPPVPALSGNEEKWRPRSKHRLSGVPQGPMAAWAKDPANAHNWSKAKRIYHTVVPASVAFACEAFGRRAVYLACTPIFALFILGSGFSRSVAALVICRLFAGIFGGSALGLGNGTICDIWPLSDVSIPIISYITMSLLGPIIGTLLGGLATQTYGFRWTQWITLYFTAASLMMILPMQETCRKSILQRRAKREGAVDELLHPRRKMIGSIMLPLYSTVTCPLGLLLEEPIVGLLSSYVAFTLALFYAFFVAFPYVFATVYGFSIEPQGLTFLGLGVGCLAGLLFFSIYDRFIYEPRVARWRAERRAEAKHKRNSQVTPSKHNSTPTSIKRKSWPSTSDPFTPSEQNIQLAVAAAIYLNAIPANVGKKIIPERVIVLLNLHPSYSDLCETLEGLGLKLDRVALAKVLTNALARAGKAAAFSRSKSLLQIANSLERPHTSSDVEAQKSSSSPNPLYMTFSAPVTPVAPLPPSIPPPEWRLSIALPGAILLPVSSFVFAWTARAGVHWMVPVFAEGLFGMGILVVLCTLTLYIMDVYEPLHGADAVALTASLSYVLAAAFSLFIVQMYEKLGTSSQPPDLRFLHYNDVYHVEAGSAEPVGGIARFQSICNYYRNDEAFAALPELLTLFSGDAFNPSLESSVTKGSHMVPVLNALGTDCACVGNHDLDFGVPHFRHLADQCTFPWLLANVLDPALGEDKCLGNAEKTTMITCSNGVKVGIIGLVEREWLDTINVLPPNLIYKSASATAKELVPGLREAGAEIVVALTHQREPNDNKLAENTPLGMIDLILGGHDHFYQHTVINSTHILRSGTDFKQLSYIEARRKRDGSKGWDFSITRRDIIKAIPEDPKTVKLVDKLTSALRSKLEKPIGYTAAPLDARFTTVRLKESNLGNFVCDLMRFYYHADCCIVAAGTIRGDQVYPPGVIRLKDIMNCFPFEDPCVVVRVKGQALLEALENSVGKHPALEGRFPQVSGIEFEFDPTKPESSRVKYVNINKDPLDLQKDYTLATRDYMVRGKDGFNSLLSEADGGTAVELVSEENGMLISMILRQYFMSLKVLGKWGNWGASMGHHWGSVHKDLHKKHPVREPITPGTVENTFLKNLPTDSRSVPSLVGKAQEEGARPSKNTESSAAQAEGGGADFEMSESEDDASELKPVPTDVSQRERELVIMRKVTKKWWRLAKLPGHPSLCDEEDEGEFVVHWTKGIAPRLEGRIKETKG
ncbi:hypothetical protein B0A49_04172 [Cryomyces minteri]|uniref:5'-Nucleotidase C-terminal domain-containing protein n=1 Tax=Cryomyces minteri TaxID=331657 RepID=A0A4U0XI02_9PEZI|nr:hypothetical protein B0A49_04172 [Cryomyces minteri]